jgi:hypothetical protein
MGEALCTIFGNWRYVLLSGITAAFTFAFAVLLPNLGLLFSIFIDPRVPAVDKLTLPVNLLGSIATNFLLLSASYTIVIALLFGINVSLIIYSLKLKKLRFLGAGSVFGSLGAVSGVFGIGCAACGSLILMSVLGTAAGAAVIAFLPLKGGEFGIIGVMLLGAATYLLARQIGKPTVCAIRP